jgi:nucleotide-binding universal stress UspA family protein
MAAPVFFPQTTPRLKNVLFATDFSDGSLAALPHAAAIVRAFGGMLHLCHIESPAPLSAGLADPHLYWAAGQDAVSRLAATRSLPVLKGLQPLLVLGEGDLRKELLRIVRESDIDLLVAGTRGRTGFRKMLLGSVIEEICRTVTCPILTVGPESLPQEHVATPSGWARAEGGTATPRRDSVPYRHILFPTNLSELSEKTVPYISLLAQRFGAQVTVLHVLPDDEASTADELTQNETVRNGMIKQFAAFAPFDSHFIVARGNTAETVLRVAREKQVGLVAMAIRNAFRPGILRERTAYRIIAGAQCPVLTVR